MKRVEFTWSGLTQRAVINQDENLKLILIVFEGEELSLTPMGL